MKITSFDEFKDLARRGTFVPVCKELVADLLTPVSAFLKIAETAPHAFLLESVEGGEHVGRYSFLGKDPFLILRAGPGKTTIEEGGSVRESVRPFVDALRAVMADYQSPYVASLPRFTGGAVGCFGYGAASWFEPVLGDLGESPDGTDTAAFMLFDTVLAFDHVRHRILIISNARTTGQETLESLYRTACSKIEALERDLEGTLAVGARPALTPPVVRSNLTRDTFEQQVRTAKEYIAAGDIFQVVLSQRFEVDVAVDPFTVYRALRHVNPSPYMYFIRNGRIAIVGSSPEMLVRVEGSRVETHPIAGTRPRGATADEDVRLGEELKRNEKERAEHVMLVDLGRNDVGRVCAYGSVRVPQFMGLERFSHVMHLTSVVEGRLADDRDRLDALVSCFPAGTVSGAPKVRAMQIIRELEPSGRGLYAGAVGYLDFAGNLDCCIAIRTIIMNGRKAFVQAGAGIVMDSNPQAEYEETCAKARALLDAIELAHTGL
jgi:anthranilate synthase component 1